MKIVIDFIPHDQQRYSTVGDWAVDDNGDWNIKISEVQESGFNALEYQLLIALHEFVEMMDCWHKGITTQEVDAFDIGWQAPAGIDEPGDDQRAPYFDSHQFACGIERQMAARLGVNWKAYNQAVDALGE